MRELAAHNRFTVGRYMKALARAKDSPEAALAFAEGQGHWTDRSQIVASFKAVVDAMATGDFSGANTPVEDAFLAAMRAESIPMNLPLRVVPPNTRIFTNASGAIAVEISEGGAIPLLKGDWTTTTLKLRKHGGLTVETDELVQSTTPAASAAIGDDLAAAVAEAENRSFITPEIAGSVLETAPSFAGSGITRAFIEVDLQKLCGMVRGAGRNGVFVAHPGTAAAVGILLNIPALGPGGGKLLGLPVITSESCGLIGSPVVRFIALLNPSRIFWTEGRVEFSASKNAALKMTDAPDATPGNLVSMFQSDSVALRAIKESNWYPRQGCAAYFTCGY